MSTQDFKLKPVPMETSSPAESVKKYLIPSGIAVYVSSGGSLMTGDSSPSSPSGPQVLPTPTAGPSGSAPPSTIASFGDDDGLPEFED